MAYHSLKGNSIILSNQSTFAKHPSEPLPSLHTNSIETFIWDQKGVVHSSCSLNRTCTSIKSYTALFLSYGKINDTKCLHDDTGVDLLIGDGVWTIWKSVSGHIVEYVVLGRISFYWTCQVDICLYEPKMASWYMDERIEKVPNVNDSYYSSKVQKTIGRLIVVDLGVIKNNNNIDTVVFGSRHVTLLRPIEYRCILCTQILSKNVSLWGIW